MAILKVISGKKLLSILVKNGFVIINNVGSHFRIKHEDGRKTTIPVHNNQDLPKGLLRKIIRDDLELDVDSFNKMIENN